MTARVKYDLPQATWSAPTRLAGAADGGGAWVPAATLVSGWAAVVATPAALLRFPVWYPPTAETEQMTVCNLDGGVEN